MEHNTGRRRSSVGRLLNALAPKRGPTLQSLIDLTPLEIDLLLSYQLSQPNPLFLGPQAFATARVAPSEDLSARIHSVLLKIAIIDPPPIDSSEPYVLPVDTSKITRNLANQLFFCGAPVIRRVVALLFVWEEHCVRLAQLDSEEREINDILTNPPPGLEDELKMRLEAVRRRRALLPSQHDEQRDSPLDAPPMYA